MKSPITGNEMVLKYIIQETEYWQDETRSLFTGCLDQENMVGGTGSRENNHSGRLNLINSFNVDLILDYGCGRGDFVQYLKNHGKNIDGYDPYSDIYKSKPNRKYDLVTMIEVIEHTCDPYNEIDEIKELLVDGGILFIETSFSNWVDDKHPYLNPKIGHSTIFSHHGLDLLMSKKGFQVGNHPNQNIRLFIKS